MSILQEYKLGPHTNPTTSYVQKYALWAAFNVTQAAILSPLMFMSPAILARAALYTVAMMGSIAFVGATAKTDKYLYLGGPLLAGVAVVAVSGFAPLVLPATAVRTLMWTENIVSLLHLTAKYIALISASVALWWPRCVWRIYTVRCPKGVEPCKVSRARSDETGRCEREYKSRARLPEHLHTDGTNPGNAAAKAIVNGTVVKGTRDKHLLYLTSKT